MIVNGRILLCAKLSSLMARLICTVPWGGVLPIKSQSTILTGLYVRL